MSQNKLLSEQIRKAKQDIKSRYLAGEAVLQIARDYGVSDRNIYYHLGELSPDDKALHARNMDLRRIANKGKEVSNVKERKEQSQPEGSQGGSESPDSEGSSSPSSLADFVEPEGEV